MTAKIYIANAKHNARVFVCESDRCFELSQNSISANVSFRDVMMASNKVCNDKSCDCYDRYVDDDGRDVLLVM